MKANWKDHIESTPDVLRGKPRFKGTRIPVSLILGYLAEGTPHADILAEFPGLGEIHIAAASAVNVLGKVPDTPTDFAPDPDGTTILIERIEQ